MLEWQSRVWNFHNPKFIWFLSQGSCNSQRLDINSQNYSVLLLISSIIETLILLSVINSTWARISYTEVLYPLFQKLKYKLKNGICIHLGEQGTLFWLGLFPTCLHNLAFQLQKFVVLLWKVLDRSSSLFLNLEGGISFTLWLNRKVRLTLSVSLSVTSYISNLFWKSLTDNMSTSSLQLRPWSQPL